MPRADGSHVPPPWLKLGQGARWQEWDHMGRISEMLRTWKPSKHLTAPLTFKGSTNSLWHISSSHASTTLAVPPSRWPPPDRWPCRAPSRIARSFAPEGRFQGGVCREKVLKMVVERWRSWTGWAIWRSDTQVGISLQWILWELFVRVSRRLDAWKMLKQTASSLETRVTDRNSWIVGNYILMRFLIHVSQKLLHVTPLWREGKRYGERERERSIDQRPC